MLVIAILVATLSPAQTIERIVVQVNGDIITRRDLDDRVRVALAQQRGRSLTGAEIRQDPDLTAAAAILTPPVLQAAIDELLVVQWARERGMEASTDTVDRVIARMREDSGVTSEEEFHALLVHEGIPADALRESVARQIAVANVRERESQVRATEEEVQKYYAAHRERYGTGARVRFHEIHTSLPPQEGEARDRALIRFVAAADRVRAGEDFDAVARDLSDAPSAPDGGSRSDVDPSTLPPAVQAALARMAPGQISEPVRVADGYVLLRLDAATPPRPATFQAWREDARRDLLEEKRSTAFDRRLARLRADAIIDWKDPALETAWRALLKR